MATVKILGLDPSSTSCGWGLVETDGYGVSHIAHGAIRPRAKAPFDERLLIIYGELAQLIERHQPDQIGIEEVFVGESAKTALKQGEILGMTKVACAGRVTSKYHPTTLKTKIFGDPKATKSQMQQAVMCQLDLDELPTPHDAADALGIAILHADSLRLNMRTAA